MFCLCDTAFPRVAVTSLTSFCGAVSRVARMEHECDSYDRNFNDEEVRLPLVVVSRSIVYLLVQLSNSSLVYVGILG